ncbi:MAG: hypothetical protein RTU09_04865 [Candidatus Thorarchaeota archaeon]
MRSELDLSFAKLMNPRMSAGLMLLHSLLDPLRGSPMAPRDVRKSVDRFLKDRKVSKQSVTNAARRLEEANIIEREEGYSVNYGYLISILLEKVMEMTDCISDLEDEVADLKAARKPVS